MKDSNELELAVRTYNADPKASIAIVPATTAFLLVDCDDSSADAPSVENQIQTALGIARQSGMKVVYVYNAVHGVGGANDVTTRIHGLDYLENSWKPLTPKFNPLIQPLDDEAAIPKRTKTVLTVRCSIII